MRRAVGESKVGHAGTLDPLASGVLVVGLGQATRLLGLITLDDKRYLARISFGAETATDDAEGDVIRTAPVDGRFADEAFARNALAALVGTFEQVPPSFSAIQVDGRRSYDRARKGDDVQLPARTVTVREAALISVDHTPEGIVWICAFHVSKGTYIRSIARDLGRSLGTAAHLCGLERTASGSVGLGQCAPLDELLEGGLEVAMAHMLDPISLLPYPCFEVGQEVCSDILNGKRVSSRRCPGIPVGESVCLVHDGRLASIVSSAGGIIVSRSNYPQGIEGVGR